HLGRCLSEQPERFQQHIHTLAVAHGADEQDLAWRTALARNRPEYLAINDIRNDANLCRVARDRGDARAQRLADRHVSSTSTSGPLRLPPYDRVLRHPGQPGRLLR